MGLTVLYVECCLFVSICEGAQGAVEHCINVDFFFFLSFLIIIAIVIIITH